MELTSCLFEGNSAGAGGGALRVNTRRWVYITDCVFINNEAGSGGAVSLNTKHLAVTDCVFENNRAGQGGAFSGGTGTFTNCIFRNNLAGNGGACWQTQGTFKNCVFAENTASGEGGALYSNAVCVDPYPGVKDLCGGAYFLHCTFWGNTAGDGSDAISSYRIGTYIINCILWEQRAHIRDDYGQVYFNTLWGDDPADDPLFVDPENGDFHLRNDSPAIDAGEPNVRFPDLPDIEGIPRPQGDGFDQGAYENDGSYPVYTVSLSVLGYGEVDPLEGDEIYLGGTELTLTATPAQGSYFHHWTVNDAVSLYNPLHITVDGAMDITALFILDLPPQCQYSATSGTPHPPKGDGLLLLIVCVALMVLPQRRASHTAR